MDLSAFEVLLTQARMGGAAGSGPLLASVRPRLQERAARQLSGRLRCKESAEDVVQNALYDISAHLEQFAGHTEPQFLRWCERILDRRVSAVVRRFVHAGARAVGREVEGGENLVEPRDPGTSPTARAVRNEDDRRLKAALDLLPADERLTVEWHDWLGRSFDEIAVELGRSANAVQKLHARALIRLGRLIRENSG